MGASPSPINTLQHCTTTNPQIDRPPRPTHQPHTQHRQTGLFPSPPAASIDPQAPTRRHANRSVPKPPRSSTRHDCYTIMALRPFLLRPTRPLHALFSPSASTRLRASISTLKGAPGQPHDDGCQKPAAHTPAPSGFGKSSTPSSPSGPAGPGASIGPRAAFHRPAPVAPTSYYRRQHSTQLVHPPPVMHGYEPSGEPEPAAGSPQQQDGGAIVTPMDDVHALPRHFHHLSNELLFHLVRTGYEAVVLGCVCVCMYTADGPPQAGALSNDSPPHPTHTHQSIQPRSRPRTACTARARRGCCGRLCAWTPAPGRRPSPRWT